MTKPRFGKHHNEPVWRIRQRLIGTAIPAALSPWLFDDGSLTQRMIESCPGEFCVRLLNQGWQRPSMNEARRLGMRLSQNAFVRHVHLCCDGVPWVFARTVIPPRTLRGAQRRLAHLGNKSLGAVLFADRSMRRTALEVARLAKGQQIYTLATHHLPRESGTIWGRRSVFSLHKHPLLVNEIFLPQLGAYRQAVNHHG